MRWKLERELLVHSSSIFVFIIMTVLTIGETTAQESSEDSFLTYHHAELCISFDYPASWNPIEVDDYRDYPHKCYTGKAAGTDWRLRFKPPRSMQCGLVLRVMRYDADNHLRTRCYEGDTWTVDLHDEREKLRSNQDRQVCGYSARVINTYFEPGASAYRVTTWFSETHFFELIESACIYNFPNSRSGGFSKLLAAHPEDEGLVAFDEYSTRLLESFRCED